MQTFFKWFLFVLTVFFLFSCSSSKNTENDSYTDSDSHTDSDDLTVIEDAENSSQDSDFIDDSDEMPGQDVDSDSENDEDLPDEANSLTQECFGKKVLTKEIVEIDWQGDGFENGIDGDYSYQIDRYYDKNCRVKFETKSKCTSANLDECDGLSSYEYDEKGNVTSICTESYCRYFSYKFNDDGSVEKMCNGKSTDKEAGCVYYRYDENGKIQRETHYKLPGYVAGADEFLEDLYWPEAEEYFYNDEGKTIRKERFFAYKEFDENNRLISVYKYDYSSFLSRTLLAKKSVKYDYYVSAAIPVTSWHNIYNFYDAIGAGWKKSRYERDYFYDENLKPVRVNINPLIGIFSWLDDEWEYYSDGSLKRKRENVESDDGQTKVTTERIYDEKGRETVYQELNALGEAKKRVEKTYYDETNLVKTENYCSEDSCTMADYSYEFDEFGRITVRNKIYENGMTADDLTIKGEITRFKYAQNGKLEESKFYWAFEDAEGNEFLGQLGIELCFYDERDNLVERRFAEEWDEENPDAAAMFAKYLKYDSFDRLIEDDRFVYDYHGNTQSTDKIWHKIGTTAYEYDPKGNLVSEKYLEPEGSAWEEYSIYFEYDENNDLVSSEKHYKENKKESRKYFYEIFKEE